jgi:uncharacterized membrane protein (DUF2068 family)
MRSGSGLKIVAAFEATKGLLILLAGFGILSLIHQDAQQVAEDIVRHFHLNPASRYPRIFLQVAGNVSDTQLWLMAGFALAYASIRLIEGYGLWHERRWAEWLAVVSSGLYVPVEVYELLLGASWGKVGTLVINLFIVVYMASVLKRTNCKGSEASPL